MGKLFQPGGDTSKNFLEVCFLGLVVRGNYVSCLVIVVIFMRFERAKRWDDALKSSFRVITHSTSRGAVFIGKRGSHYVILLH